jgi:hypothetical protein
MQNSITGARTDSLARDQSAMQNGGLANRLKLVTLWLAVGLPLIWGVVKALRDGSNMTM